MQKNVKNKKIMLNNAQRWTA